MMFSATIARFLEVHPRQTAATEAGNDPPPQYSPSVCKHCRLPFVVPSMLAATREIYCDANLKARGNTPLAIGRRRP